MSIRMTWLMLVGGALLCFGCAPAKDEPAGKVPAHPLPRSHHPLPPRRLPSVIPGHRHRQVLDNDYSRCHSDGRRQRPWS